MNQLVLLIYRESLIKICACNILIKISLYIEVRLIKLLSHKTKQRSCHFNVHFRRYIFLECLFAHHTLVILVSIDTDVLITFTISLLVFYL